MKTGKRTLGALALALLCAPSQTQVQVRITQESLLNKIVECMSETSPKDWRELVFTLDQESPDRDNPGKMSADESVHLLHIGRAGCQSGTDCPDRLIGDGQPLAGHTMRH